MRFLNTRIRAISAYLGELLRHGLPRQVGNPRDEVLFILDGVGGMQFVPLLARRALREEGMALATVFNHWQYGLPGEIWTDLMWHRRNRVMAGRFARMLLRYRRQYPQSRMHLLGCSGGAGIAVFALESLRGRQVIETLLLACPGLSPTYNLAPALRTVRRCYALVSHRDTAILGLGTRLFGTTDRRYTPAAGCAGFTVPAGLSAGDRAAYDRLWEVPWTPDLGDLGHYGGHTGWAAMPFLRKHLLPLVRGETPLLTRRSKGFEVC